MSPYSHFTTDERLCIQNLLASDFSIRKIAACLGRSPSSVSREIKRNSGKKGYNFWWAQSLTIYRHRNNARRRILPDTPEWDYITEKLESFWSPEEITGRWRLEHPEAPHFGTSTIYRYISRGAFPDISRKTHLRRRGRPRCRSRSACNAVKPDRLITQWPQCIKQRLRKGDWEGDTVCGGIGKGCIITMVDRRTHYLNAALLDKRDAGLTKDTIAGMLKDYPVKSISLDNGSEFAGFRALEQEICAPVYCAEPHKPWQRGLNENTNGLLRFFFPKGCDFRRVTSEQLKAVVESINNRPRKCFGFLSPMEVFAMNTVALD